MTTFPGAIYAVDGRRLDRRGKALTSVQLYRYEHRSVVSRPQPLAVIGEDTSIEVGRVWVLNNTAYFEAIPAPVADKTISYICGGAPLLLLSTNADVVRNIREMMLVSLLIAQDMFRAAKGATT